MAALEFSVDFGKTEVGNSLVLPYGVGIVGMVGNELGKIHEAQFFPN